MKKKPVTKEYSVTEYANKVGLTRFGVIYQINHNTLPDKVTARKIGRSYVITVTDLKSKSTKELTK